MELLASLRPIDRELACYVRDRGGSELVAIAAALASFALSSGDTCIDLMTLQESQLWPDRSERPQLPENRESWFETVRREQQFCAADGSTILTLCGSRIYLTRYFRYEQIVLQRIRQSLIPRSFPQISEETRKLMMRLFATDADFSLFGGDLQLAGSLLPLFFPFAVISGGPGTGKTTTVAKLLALRLAENPSLRIALAAPTGKAAQRMNESIRSSLRQLDLPKSIATALQCFEATTIHRLLGVNHLSPTFRRNGKNPLEIDLIVVDEASMIDLPLLAKLIDAVPETASIILLGDQFQLSSVEAGSVLGDICGSFKNNQFSSEFCAVHEEFASPKNAIVSGPSFSPIIQLNRSFRFDPHGGVGYVSRKINEGDCSIAEELLDKIEEVQLLADISTRELLGLSEPIRSATSAEEALAMIGSGMILTVRNDGAFGQETINRLILNKLKQFSTPAQHNMPLMITENSYERNLFNGDMGVLRCESGEWIAHFPDGDRTKQIPQALLPKWQPAFAITIHKSQGSEYNRVIILPGESDSPLFTRELLYTAITRVKPISGSERGAVRIQGTPELIASTISRRVVRGSGLRAELQSV